MAAGQAAAGGDEQSESGGGKPPSSLRRSFSLKSLTRSVLGGKPRSLDPKDSQNDFVYPL